MEIGNIVNSLVNQPSFGLGNTGFDTLAKNLTDNPRDFIASLGQPAMDTPDVMSFMRPGEWEGPQGLPDGIQTLLGGGQPDVVAGIGDAIANLGGEGSPVLGGLGAIGGILGDLAEQGPMPMMMGVLGSGLGAIDDGGLLGGDSGGLGGMLGGLLGGGEGGLGGLLGGLLGGGEGGLGGLLGGLLGGGEGGLGGLLGGLLGGGEGGGEGAQGGIGGLIEAGLAAAKMISGLFGGGEGGGQGGGGIAPGEPTPRTPGPVAGPGAGAPAPQGSPPVNGTPEGPAGPDAQGPAAPGDDMQAPESNDGPLGGIQDFIGQLEEILNTISELVQSLQDAIGPLLNQGAAAN